MTFKFFKYKLLTNWKDQHKGDRHFNYTYNHFNYLQEIYRVYVNTYNHFNYLQEIYRVYIYTRNEYPFYTFSTGTQENYLLWLPT